LFRIRGKFKNYSLIRACAPAEENSEREKHQLYERLHRMHKRCPSYNIIIILGEMNARVGKEIWTGIAMGTCGLHDDSNDNRTRPINYAVRQCTVIGGHYSDTETYIKKYSTDLTTESANQIDHVMNDQ
jgi:hypothetical protein